jgi:antitoxin FitA
LIQGDQGCLDQFGERQRSLWSLALLRYFSAVATIQIREIPEESYEVLRRRARRAGQSMQAYMRDEIVAIAARPTKGEAIAMIEAILGQSGGPDPTINSVLDDLATERR